jgi:5-(carboxyamino)imidazole ribonucleotide synthase
VLLPGATLGVMGGGQLGRMFVQAAQAMGYFTAVLDPDPTSPAGMIAHYHIKADYLDEAGLAQLMQRCDAITTEFENVPAAALRTLGAHRTTAPRADAVEICQDRTLEKEHFANCDMPCAPWAPIESIASVEQAPDALLPGLLKTARMGYDGKGQVAVADRDELRAAWQVLGGQRCVLEKRLALECELSAIVARGADGACVGFPVQQNRHRDGILAVTQTPAPDVPEPLQRLAIELAERLADELGYIGVLCVEFFVVDGGLIANEMAPRPHNSGHASIDACDASQFELQVRTLAGLPLVEPRAHSAAVMLNLLGELWFDDAGGERSPDWPAVLALPGTHLHLYGKASPRPGRKMGHL